MNSQQSHYENIERNLDERIEKIIKMNTKYESFLRSLESIEKEMEPGLKSHERGVHQEVSVSTDSELNLPKGIDDILEKAKSIRTMNEKRTKKRGDEEKKTERKRSSSAPRGATTSRLIPPKRVESQTETMSHPPSLRIAEPIPKLPNERSNLNLILAQTQIIRGLECPLLSILPTKSFLISQYRFLTSLQGSPCFPPSLLDQVIQRMTGPVVLKSFPLPVYVTCLRRIRQEYEKSTQSKLQRLHPTALTETEIANLYLWWFLLRRCISFHENYNLQKQQAKTSSASLPTSSSPTRKENTSSAVVTEETNRLQNLISQMIYEYPLLPSRLSSSSSLSPHYHAFESRVRYTVETIISRSLLKEVLQELKECCAEEIANSRPSTPGRVSTASRKGSRVQWKHALQGLQAMETCLLNGVQTTGPTIFFEKKKGV
jgi:hypothetical protein